ncbi:Uncharacterised protein [Mycobacteroides abscessus subsp. massiliense]|uniref:hypothetical protein n=1 Tax=Mycobacteroides abscessus TaxID=36809 RepID=UPI0009A861F9|nr:hypothetical protein [Mycobacteroides abscessus]SLH95653.1 Uncharacterised protein [Mycobacteroides abscessus subsp. massiliense]SLI84588.1 Uncharacterised protein [Mycobacteroides abscessus subsp. massiliense]
MLSKPKQPDDDRQHDVTIEPTDAQHDGEITCKGYGPPQPVSDPECDNDNDETSSPKEIR